MQTISWSKEYEIEIPVIDKQHQRIVEYINDLIVADENADAELVATTMEALVDYTYSHFAFEEALMEEAGYEFFGMHQQTHNRFSAQLNNLYQRYKQQENVASELGEMLLYWLLNHIRHDDTSYAPVVKKEFSLIQAKDSGGWLGNKIKSIFG